MYTQEDKIPLQHLAALAKIAAAIRAVQICRYLPKQSQSWTLALAADPSVVTSAMKSPNSPRAISGHGLLEAIFLAGQAYCGPIETLCTDLVEGHALSQFVRTTGIRYVLILPIVVSNRVEGALCLYDGSPLGEEIVRRMEPVVAILQGLFGYMVRRQESKKSLRRVQRVGASLAESEERLRREIASELHGRIQGKLLIVWHELQKVLDSHAISEPVTQCLQRLAETVDQVREIDIRQLSHRLHPVAIRIALRPALAQLMAQYESVMDVHVEFNSRFLHFDNPMHNHIPEKIRLTTYRLVEEALVNAMRHGHAPRADVRIALRGNILEASVSDTGQGFTVSPAVGGLGLELMEDRIRALRGTFRIRSKPGQGTLVQACIPLASTVSRTQKRVRLAAKRSVYP
ncbi:sensor histidine kinase [Sulfobacillus harzensis]|uniref:histidine kinase n=1 Tax=Sulfobacillus harzensis TaxID=2729629 RepID=A0A7Y0L4S4_9FIRM|nr:ATP-binding protein [Sulfobacillus harzensis]NMP22957.1 hypothetical protein [Sulfobacillus harzensis]